MRALAVFAAALAALVGANRPLQAQSRPSVAVMDFDTSSLDHWWGPYDIGKGMADLMTEALHREGTLAVVERRTLNNTLSALDVPQSDRSDPTASTLAKIGRAVGARYILLGAVTTFTTQGTAVGVSVKGIGIGGGKGSAAVALGLRLVDTTTGQAVLSADALGQATAGTAFDFRQGGFCEGFRRTAWDASALGQAHQKAQRELVASILAVKGRLQ